VSERVTGTGKTNSALKRIVRERVKHDIQARVAKMKLMKQQNQRASISDANGDEGVGSERVSIPEANSDREVEGGSLQGSGDTHGSDVLPQQSARSNASVDSLCSENIVSPPSYSSPLDRISDSGSSSSDSPNPPTPPTPDFRFAPATPPIRDYLANSDSISVHSVRNNIIHTLRNNAGIADNDAINAITGSDNNDTDNNDTANGSDNNDTARSSSTSTTAGHHSGGDPVAHPGVLHFDPLASPRTPTNSNAPLGSSPSGDFSGSPRDC
jgi:hypothetical protein